MMRIEAPTPTQAICAIALLRGYQVNDLEWASVPSHDPREIAKELLTDKVSAEWSFRRICLAVDHHLPKYSIISDGALFQQLVLGWYKERGATSSITQIFMSPAYHRIIGMGERAVPFILAQLEREADDPDHWGWALHAITGENPVPPEVAGDTVGIAAAWLSWGRSRYAW